MQKSYIFLLSIAINLYAPHTHEKHKLTKIITINSSNVESDMTRYRDLQNLSNKTEESRNEGYSILIRLYDVHAQIIDTVRMTPIPNSPEERLYDKNDRTPEENIEMIFADISEYFSRSAKN